MLANGVTRIDLPNYQGAPPLGSEGDLGLALPCFIAGPENHIAVPVLQQLLSGTEQSQHALAFNPLVLFGPTGTGKSHLARGIVRQLHEQHEPQTTEYFTAIDFAREVRAARAEEQLEALRQRLANLSVLVIEDLQRLPERPFIQRELRDTLDSLVDAGRMVILTAQQSPTTMASLEVGLRDRLTSGLTIRLRAPGTEARYEILQLAAEQRNLSLNQAQLQSLVQRLDGSAPQLLRALSEFELTPDSSDVTHLHRSVELKQIIAVVARYFSLTQTALKSSARRKSLVHARCVVIHLARKLTDLSYAQIGNGLGHRDHTTIMHAQRSIERQLADDPTTQQAVDELHRILTAV